MNTRQLEELLRDIYNSTFTIADNVPELDGYDAGKLARCCELAAEEWLKVEIKVTQ